jgi:hypothetical protein
VCLCEYIFDFDYVEICDFFLVSKEPALIVIMSREFVAERLSVFRFQRSFSGHRFKDDREAKTFVTRWLIT